MQLPDFQLQQGKLKCCSHDREGGRIHPRKTQTGVRVAPSAGISIWRNARDNGLTGVAAELRGFPERGFCGEASGVAGPI